MTGDYNDDVDDDDDSDDDCDNDDTDDDDSVVLMIVITMTKLEVTEIFRTTNPLRQKWNYKNLRLTILVQTITLLSTKVTIMELVYIF